MNVYSRDYYLRNREKIKRKNLARWRSLHPILPKQCDQCAVVFTPPKNRDQKYCSARCRYKFTGKKMPFTPKRCLRCGVSFTPFGDYHVYCSPKCRPVRYVKSVPKSFICDQCGAEFHTVNTSTKRCSDKCRKTFERKQNKAEYLKNVVSNRAKAVAYVLKRLKTDPLFRVTMNLRNRVRQLIKRTHPTLSVAGKRFIGCTVSELRVHLESQFTGAMSWDNYGKKWVVDHRIPLASFNLLDERERKLACHYTNLQPLTWRANAIKGDSVHDAQIGLL